MKRLSILALLPVLACLLTAADAPLVVPKSVETAYLAQVARSDTFYTGSDTFTRAVFERITVLETENAALKQQLATAPSATELAKAKADIVALQTQLTAASKKIADIQARLSQP